MRKIKKRLSGTQLWASGCLPVASVLEFSMQSLVRDSMLWVCILFQIIWINTAPDIVPYVIPTLTYGPSYINT